MYLLRVDHSQNEKYWVTKNAIDQMVKQTIKICNDVEWISNNSVQSVNKNNVFIMIKIKMKNNGKYSKIFPALIDKINSSMKKLINRRPSNIQIGVTK